jgi:hypothetical protein
MDLFNYEEFLPLYPDLKSPSLQQKIVNKKEFYDLRLSRNIEDRDSEGWLRHQKIIQRFLSPHTLYDELFVYHSTGTGKTGVAFSVTENLYASKSFAQVVVLAKGDALLVSHRKELVERYSQRYAQKIPQELEPEQKNRFYKRLVSDFYQFRTFETFASQLAGLSDDVISNRFSNTIYIIDEVHNIAEDTRPKEARTEAEKVLRKRSVSIYEQFHRLFHVTQNRKILLMSATPMRNDVSELAYLMNLILPLNEQMPVGKTFLKKFVVNDKIIQEDLIKKYLRGRMSILLPAPSDVKVDYKGDFLPPLNVLPFKIFKTQMDTVQLQTYIEAYTNDTEKNDAVYSNVRQAALFVFPDGSFGKTGFKHYSTKEGLQGSLVREINTVEKLARFSSKYAFIVKNLIENRNKLVYIYCNMVDGSGANLLSRILKVYGYNRSNGIEKGPGKRFILLTSETPNVGLLKDYFNHPRNRYGEYCHVIIGSRRISEGFTFKNVQIIHITTLFWNYTETQQAVARAIRYMSHEDLLADGLDPVVEVYQHASVSNNPKYKIRSIDEMMLEYSQRKDLLIRKMDRIIKEISFDCPLVYERNYIEDDPDSRNCDYQECEYKCDGGLEPTRLDYTTYNLYYQGKDDQGLLEGIRQLFKTHFRMRFETLQDILMAERLQLLRVLSQIIRYNIPIINAYNIESFLREDHNEYYLVDNVVLPNQHIELGTYCQYPFITENRSLEETIQQKVYRHQLATVQQIQKAESEEQVKELLETLPLELQEIFLEMTWIHSGKNRGNGLSEWIQNIYQPYIRETDQHPVVSTLLQPRMRCFVPREKKWRDCVLDEPAEETVVAVDAENNPYGYYGIIEEDRFCIRDMTQALSEDGTKIDKRKIKTGSNCLEVGFNKPKLAEICMHLNLSVPENELHPNPRSEFMKNRSGQKVLEKWNDWSDKDLAIGLYWYTQTKKDVCDRLKEWFAEHNLLIRDKCGKTGKVKQ